MDGFSTLSRKATRLLAASGVALALSVSLAVAETANQPRGDAEWKDLINGGTVRIITKGLGCTCTVVASDMARVLNDMGQLRVLPVLGHGSLQGIADVMYLQGIDLSIVQSDVLAYVKRNRIHPNIDANVRYVAKLYNSELHLLAGPGIESVEDLNGKTVNFDVEGRGSFITAQNVFETLGIVTNRVNLERDVAIEKLKRGEIDATFVVTGKPADSMLALAPEDGLRFLPVPFVPALAETYLPSRLSHEDYPNMIPEGQEVKTVAVGEVLAVYNWEPGSERYKKLALFVDALFNNIEKFYEPVRHRKWRDVNLAAVVPGWQRFQPAQDWLDSNTPQVSRLADLRSSFQQFLEESGYAPRASATADNQEVLFQRFLEWAKQQ